MYAEFLISFFWLKLLHSWRDESIFQSTFCSCRRPTLIWWVIICPLLHPLGILKEPLLSCSLRTILDLNILHPFGDCSSEFLIDLPVDLMMLCLMIVFSSHLTYPVPWCKLLLAQSLMISSSDASCWLSQKKGEVDGQFSSFLYTCLKTCPILNLFAKQN